MNKSITAPQEFSLSKSHTKKKPEEQPKQQPVVTASRQGVRSP